LLFEQFFSLKLGIPKGLLLNLAGGLGIFMRLTAENLYFPSINVFEISWNHSRFI